MVQGKFCNVQNKQLGRIARVISIISHHHRRHEVIKKWLILLLRDKMSNRVFSKFCFFTHLQLPTQLRLIWNSQICLAFIKKGIVITSSLNCPFQFPFHILGTTNETRFLNFFNTFVSKNTFFIPWFTTAYCSEKQKSPVFQNEITKRNYN